MWLPEIICLCRPEVSSKSDRPAMFGEVYAVGMLERTEDRTSHGGGVAVWMKSGTTCQYLESFQCYDHKVRWLSVAAKTHGHVVVGSVYRPGSCHGGDTQLLDYLDTTIDIWLPL